MMFLFTCGKIVLTFPLIIFGVHLVLLSSAMEFIGKLCTQEENDEVIEAGLECVAYESLIKVLVVPDVQVCCCC